MFDIETKPDLPFDYLEIDAISVRGELGPVTVWVTPEPHHTVYEMAEAWHQVYKGNHNESMQTLVSLPLDKHIILKPGESCAIYVHSGARGDGGIVYDNKRHSASYEDSLIRVLPGMAHLSNKPFGRHGYWGWGAWRQNREFVGNLSYGVRWKLWTPVVHKSFPEVFQEVIRAVMMAANRQECVLYRLHFELVLVSGGDCANSPQVHYILNHIHWWDYVDSADKEAGPTACPRSQELYHHGYGGWGYHLPVDSDSDSDGDYEDDDDDDCSDDVVWTPCCTFETMTAGSGRRSRVPGGCVRGP